MKKELFDLELNKNVETQKNELNPQSGSLIKTTIKASKKFCKGVTLTCGCHFTGKK